MKRSSQHGLGFAAYAELLPQPFAATVLPRWCESACAVQHILTVQRGRTFSLCARQLECELLARSSRLARHAERRLSALRPNA
eukprot:4253901-Pleurochrysis_carterae.AAC.2